MEVFNPDFLRLSETPVADLFGEIGVYVLWDGQAKARPSYIGEGAILKRLVEHTGRFAYPLDGYVAVVEASTWQRAKSISEIIEALLLAVASETDRTPSVNVAAGKLRGLDAIFRTHGTLRIHIRGLDPLLPPWESCLLPQVKRIVLRKDSNGDLELDHDWRLRRRRR